MGEILLSSEKCGVRDYFDRLNADYDKWFEKPFSGFVRQNQFIFFKSHVRPHEKILEIGCGTGEFLARIKAAQKVGIDVSKEMINVARKKCRHENISFVASSSDKLPFLDSSFDKVLMPNVIQYLEKPDFTIKEIYRVTKNGGECIFSVYNKWGVSLNPARWFIRRKIFRHSLPPINFYSARQIKNILYSLEIKDFFIAGCSIRPPFESYVIFRLLKRFISRCAEKYNTKTWFMYLVTEFFVVVKKNA